MSEIKVNTHTVIKKTDAQKYLTEAEWDILMILSSKIENCRIQEGKKPNQYYICNIDEPYSQVVLKTILDGETVKQNISQGLL